MSSIQSLRDFFNERLNTFTEDVFRVFEKTIAEYEEEIHRQRTLLDVAWKPAVKLHKIELPLQYICKEEEEEVLNSQQHCNQERNFSLDQEDPEPPQIKEEQEELLTNQDREQLVVKQETDTFMLSLTFEEGDHSEDQTLHLKPDESQSAAEKVSTESISTKSSEVPESNPGHQLLSHNHHLAENQDHKAGKHGDSVPSRNAETQQRTHNENNIHSNNVLNSTISKIPCNTHTGKNSFKCDTCGKAFKEKSKLIRHLIIHTGQKPHSCNICGKRFNQTSTLQVHRKTHTGERPFSCNICSKRFGQASVLKIHKKIHTGEKPHPCNICGKRFAQISALNIHKRIHTGEKPYSCNDCGKRFIRTSALNAHLKTHTGEKPYSCKTCGKCLRSSTGLMIHMRTHTGEKPYSCSTCGNRFTDRSVLKRHMRRHTGVRPHVCSTCGKTFYETTELKRHSRVHTGEKSCS